MSEMVDLLHDYVDSYDRVSQDADRLQSCLDRLRVDLLTTQSTNRELLKEIAAYKEAQPVYRSRHDYILLHSILTKANAALQAVNLHNQANETVVLVQAALMAIEKL